ncbi:Alpha/Beta hydrolase protein [Boeremia exigua]|uniref:Alpha/Beta hydrolase protein n=1 Tax=Boeremia exigua TaxID=749465 RepID=UPI001E8E5F2D|nr:Alpha/Beta hydrolase protein [Boeremia exigua]KAH6639030.1 Alpha/Beta hydrolase protein [Boeremia exigua]
MQTIQEDPGAILPYNMHVSSRYLDLTRQKLELTRLPKENGREGDAWALGTPKSVLEPLLDYWLETYDWRASEERFNAALPQFRTLPALDNTNYKEPVRTHFVHARSPDPTAFPLLYIHDWPGSFIEATRLLPLLTSPPTPAHPTDSTASTAPKHPPAFHVVVPSIPGFGFSDASPDPSFGAAGAAAVFAGLMRRLGYAEYVVCGSGWGFEVARALARRGEGVVGVFTWNPVFGAPTARGEFGAWVRWLVARVTGARWPGASFGYVPAEVRGVDEGGGEGGGRGAGARPLGPVLHQLLASRPQTLAFSLCDSPVGLLGVLLDLVAARGEIRAPAVRPRSPFLDPGELEMQDREYEAAGHERVRSDDTIKAADHNGNLTDLTCRMWLPGAEAGLRWLRRAHIETSAPTWRAYCSVPLGISSFRTRAAATPLMWGAASWPIAWVQRHQEAAEMPAWEAPELLAGDVRECFGRLLDGRGRSAEVMV